ncbi:MAG: hypothetical protein ACP5OA_06300 [Candidatus Woesearchaeota archaeon]
MDFIIGIILFILIIFVALKIMSDMYPSEEYITVYRDAVHLSDRLLSEGYPLDWNTTTVILPGIAENNRINLTKLSLFKELDYYHAKTLMHVTSEYIFFIRNSTGIINISQCTYGYDIITDENCTPILDTINYNNLARIDRFVLYNSTVVSLIIYSWN